MTTKTWNGATDSFANAADWSPAGVPMSGDVAVINTGTVSATGSISGVAVQLNESAGAAAASTLSLSDATIDAAGSLTLSNAQAFTTAPAPTVLVSGTTRLQGTTAIYGTKGLFTVASGANLVNAGTIDAFGSALDVEGGAFANSGTVAFLNPGSGIALSVINSAVTGTGTMALGAHATIEFGGAVGSGQTIVFNDGPGAKETVQFNDLPDVHATLSGFSSGDNLLVNTKTAYTGFSFANGNLTLNGIGSFGVAGNYAQSDFSVQSEAVSDGSYNILLSTTNGANTVEAGLPPGYQNGGAGGQPVYRFFDTIYGTHLFTQSTGEAQSIVANRPDLTQETNGFGAVSASSPSAEPVYRFFEQANGTHFFTSSQSEFAGLTTPGTPTYRGDFTYEPSSTFYEHASQQAGDVAVYRLFDSVKGTQFLTGDQNEFNGLTTPGSASYRADLKPEGIAFYAPAGTYHT